MRCPKFRAQDPCPEIGAACYRTDKAQIPKSAGESAGKSADKKGTAGGTAGNSAAPLLFLAKPVLPALFPAVPSAVPPAVPLFPGTLPSTLGDLGFLSPVAGGPNLNPCPDLVPKFGVQTTCTSQPVRCFVNAVGSKHLTGSCVRGALHHFSLRCTTLFERLSLVFKTAFPS